MDTERSKELWDRLENEPERAYRAFESFLGLPSGERTVVEAYRSHVGNPDAIKPSDTWTGWSRDFAWRERATAYEEHVANKRRDAFERGIEEEAEKQGALAERIRGQKNELMTLGYVRAMEWLENAQPSDLRAPDVMRIIGLHLDYLKAFPPVDEPRAEDDWTEEDEARMTEIIRKVDALTDPERPEEEEGGDEEDSENTESDPE